MEKKKRKLLDKSAQNVRIWHSSGSSVPVSDWQCRPVQSGDDAFQDPLYIRSLSLLIINDSNWKRRLLRHHHFEILIFLSQYTAYLKFLRKHQWARGPKHAMHSSKRKETTAFLSLEVHRAVLARFISSCQGLITQPLVLKTARYCI